MSIRISGDTATLKGWDATKCVVKGSSGLSLGEKIRGFFGGKVCVPVSGSESYLKACYDAGRIKDENGSIGKQLGVTDRKVLVVYDDASPFNPDPDVAVKDKGKYLERVKQAFISEYVLCLEIGVVDHRWEWDDKRDVVINTDKLLDDSTKCLVENLNRLIFSSDNENGSILDFIEGENSAKQLCVAKEYLESGWDQMFREFTTEKENYSLLKTKVAEKLEGLKLSLSGKAEAVEIDEDMYFQIRSLFSLRDVQMLHKGPENETEEQLDMFSDVVTRMSDKIKSFIDKVENLDQLDMVEKILETQTVKYNFTAKGDIIPYITDLDYSKLMQDARKRLENT